MRTTGEIDKLADDALNSIDNLQEVDANPFLFGKILSRMQAIKQQHAVNIKVMARLSIALLLFIGLNVSSYYLINRSHTQQKQTTASQALANEYNLKTGGYDY